MKRSGLRSDPEATRAFVERGREKARRSAGALSDPAIQRAFVEREREKSRSRRIPANVRAAAIARSHGACVMCLHRANLEVIRPAAVQALLRRRAVRSAKQVHHAFPRQTWPELTHELANLVGVCAGCHDEHERAHRRLPWAVLPPETIALAAGDDKRRSFLERTYPRTDSGRHPDSTGSST